jgi:hypothetical protein
MWLLEPTSLHEKCSRNLLIFLSVYSIVMNVCPTTWFIASVMFKQFWNIQSFSKIVKLKLEWCQTCRDSRFQNHCINQTYQQIFREKTISWVCGFCWTMIRRKIYIANQAPTDLKNHSQKLFKRKFQFTSVICICLTQNVLEKFFLVDFPWDFNEIYELKLAPIASSFTRLSQHLQRNYF